MGERVTAGWWRRNAIALGAIVVLAPATVAVVSMNNWVAWDLGHPTRAIPVAGGESADYGGATIGGARAAFDDDVPGTPSGARVVTVTIEIDPHGEGVSCTTTLREQGGAQREWTDDGLDLDRPYDPDRITYCDSDRTEPYTMSLDYLVPEDASGPFTVDLSTSSELPGFLRLAVSP